MESSESEDSMSIPSPDRGQFHLEMPEDLSLPSSGSGKATNIPSQILENGLNSSDEDLLLSMSFEDIEYLAASNVLSEVESNKMELDLNGSALEELPPPETPCLPIPATGSRFYKASEEEMKNLFDERQSKNTKKNTAWGIKVFQDWNIEVSGRPMDLVNVTVDDLADSLRQFYAEARPKKTEMSADENQMYHKNTLINIRGAINRHLTDIHRDIDIIRDKQFKKANGVLDGLLKLRARSGTLKPTNHKEIIDKMHMERISTYLSNCSTNPIILRQNVWFNLSIHFVTRGMEFHHQLSTNSFTFHKNEPLDSEYVTINHSTQQKNYQGGIHSDEAPQDKRMYSTGTASCPVKMLKLLISTSDTVDGPCALFTQYKRNAVESPSTHEFWYTRKPLSKRTFSNFLADICKSAGVDKKYTPHCLRATAIQFLNDQGHETRHIMFMSSHKNESSLRSYTRNLSTCQKKP